MCQHVHKEFYILPRPSKAVTQGKSQYIQKEVYLLSRPSKLQPMLHDCGTPPLQPMANYSIASPLQLITQCTPREKDLPQLLSTLGTQEMYQTHQELIRRQQNKPEKSYIELTPGTPVWVQHRQNTSWEPATVVSQCTTNSYWIMQENGTEQPKVYRRTRSMLKIRCTPTEVEQTGYRNSQLTETEKAKFHTPVISNMARNCIKENSLENVSPDLVQLTVQCPHRALILKLLLLFLIQNQKKGRKLQMYLHLHLHLHWRWLRNQVLTLQDPESQQIKNFGKPASSFSDFYMYHAIHREHLDQWITSLKC